MAIQGVIFDFNGTLFKDGHYHVKAWQMISEEITGKKMTVEEINEKTHGACNEVTIDRLSNGKFSKEENLAWSRKKEALYRKMVKQDKDNAHLVPGCAELFDWLLENQIPFTIASASIWDNIEFFYTFFDLGRWFALDQIIYDNGSYPDKVPMFLDAAELLKTPVENTLIFEDSQSGLASAIKAGFNQIIMIADDEERIQALSKNEKIIACGNDFETLFPAIQQLIK